MPSVAAHFAAAKAAVRAFAAGPMADEGARVAFGPHVTGDQVAQVVDGFDRDGWPTLGLADLGAALGAYLPRSGTIYISRHLLHEIGHAIDDRLPGPEAEGDEGAIFAELVREGALPPARLHAFRNLDDHGFLVIGGERYAAEFAGPTYGRIKVDGDLSDWTPADRIDTPVNSVPGYVLYGTIQDDTYLISIKATAAADQVIGDGTIIWLNTDQNTTTGYSPFGNIGADYNVTFNALGVPYLYTGAAGATPASPTPLDYKLSPDGKSLEIAIPRSLLTAPGMAPPTSISVAGEIDNVGGNAATAVYLPRDYTLPEYVITDPATLIARTSTHRVAIVYSDTSAKRYFSPTAYADLFMAAQNQARMAGVNYDLIDESKLTDVANLVRYDALIFPSMANVDTTQLPAIVSALNSAVYNYHISIITSGDFLTNDQAGAPLPNNSYATMESLLNLVRYAGDNTSTVTVTANDVANPIMSGYTAGQVIHTYQGSGYAAYQGVTDPADVLVTQVVAGLDPLPGVVQTYTGARNVHFATAGLFGDNNLLSSAIQSVVLGTAPGVKLDISRQAGIVAARMDMDQSQFKEEVSPVDDNGAAIPGIYDKLVPLLQQWKQQYNFVGTYFINIGGTQGGTQPGTTDWARSLPYYQAMEALGGEIGNHSYTHLLNPPTTTATAKTAGALKAGDITITLETLPSFAGVTVGMIVNGLNIGANTPVSGTAGEGGAVANTLVTAVSGNTITIGYYPGGYGSADSGVLGDIPSGTALTFSVPSENTNFLQTAPGTVTGSASDPFTYDFEFNQSKIVEAANLGRPVYGAAVPGAPETYTTAQNIMPYYGSAAPTATASGYTGYVSGGWTGIGAGYPNAIGYMTPSSQNSLYIAPNVTFDFTEIEYQGKSIEQATADWAAQVDALTANAAGTPVIVWPIHDYGAAAWDTSGTGTSPYTTQLFTNFIAQAAAKNYEFVTLEDLASRIAAEQKATVDYTTAGNTINVSITPDPTSPDLGQMALKVINGGSNVIQNVANWYAYDTQQLFVPQNGGTFTVNLGSAPDDVTHITRLSARADLLGTTGDGTNLSFAIRGDGTILVDLKDPSSSIISIQGAPAASLAGDQLLLTFADTLSAPLYAPLQHDVSIRAGATAYQTLLDEIVFGTLGADVFRPVGSGHDTYYGNGGTDSVVFSGPSTSYLVGATADGKGTVVQDLRAGSPDGTATLFNITNLFFGSPAPVSIAASGAGITNGAGGVGLGAAVTLAVTFSQAVTVAGGTPTLTLNDGGLATYASGSGSTVLTFSYVVAAGQNTAQLAASSLDLPAGTTLRNAVGVDAVLTSVPPLTGVVQVNSTVPKVLAITTSGPGIVEGAGLIGLGRTVTLQVTFDQAVTVAGGAPALALNDGATATYAGGSGTAALAFTYTVAAGQTTPDLAVTALNLPAGVTVRNAVGTNADVSPAANYNPAGALQIDGTVPVINSIAASGAGITNGSGVVGVGKTVTLLVVFSQAVTVAGGTPALALNDGGTATYTGGSGTASLTFAYTVLAGQSTPDLAVASFNLPAGVTVRSVAGSDANLSAAVNYNPNGTLKIDAAAPAVASITTSGTGIVGGTGILGTGKSVTLLVTFSQAVNVAGGTPTLTLNDGGTARYASGSGTAALSFTYTVAAGQTTPDLAVASLNLPAGTTIRSASGVNADLSPAANYNPAGTLQIDSTAPAINAIATSGTGITNGTGTVGVGAVVTLTVNFNEAVIVAGGTPTLRLNDNATATYASGSGTNALAFRYTVAAGQNTTDLAVLSAALNGATIRDLAGNNANLAAAATNPAGTLQVATTPPRIASITTSGPGIVNGAGTLGIGKTVAFALNMSAAVTVTGGTPTLGLNDGGVAAYTGGSGSNSLTFAYTVAAGQNTADLTVTSMALQGASIRDAAGNAFVPPTSGTNPAGTLVIDTTPPRITIASVAGNNIVNAAEGASGFAVKGTTSGTGGVENGQIVSVQFLNAARQVVSTVTAPVQNNNWSANVTGAQATALADGAYTAVASVSDKAGNPASSPSLAFTVAEGRSPAVARISSATVLAAATTTPQFIATPNAAPASSQPAAFAATPDPAAFAASLLPAAPAISASAALTTPEPSFAAVASVLDGTRPPQVFVPAGMQS